MTVQPVESDESARLVPALMRLARMERTRWSEAVQEATAIVAGALDGSRVSVRLAGDVGAEAAGGLRVPIRNSSRTAGWLCVERADGRADWGNAERGLAEAAAEALGQALAVEDRPACPEEVRLSETRFRTMFEQFPLSVQILSPDGRTIQVNRAFEELFGATKETLGEFNLLADEQLRRNGVLPLLERGFQGEPTVIPPVLFDPAQVAPGMDRPARWLQGFVFPVKDREGATREVIVVHQDVSERLQAEREVLESEERFKSAFERSSIAMALVDLQDRYLQVNEAFSELFGYSPEEMRQFTTASLSHPDDLARLQRDMKKTNSVLSGSSDRFRVEKRYRRKDGSLFWAVVGVSLVRDAEGEPVYWICQVQDITEQRRAEEELRRTHEELEARVEQRTAELASANAALQAEIAERRRAEEELQRTASELQAIFRALPDLYFRLASDGTILDYRAGHSFGLYAPPEV
ncbi:MAG TPA: PAS domain S-box protein, partial [Armatimonadota bacterium]|nr:PAS domain S-box protein [Armatimonadota bacterium]